MKFLRLFRSLNLLTKEFSHVFDIVYGGAHAGTMCVALFCTYGAIRLHRVVVITSEWMGSNVIVVLCILISQLGNINHSSKLTLKVIRKRQALIHCTGKQAQSRWLRREILCLRDLRVRMGFAFYYDKVLLLTTL